MFRDVERAYEKLKPKVMKRELYFRIARLSIYLILVVFIIQSGAAIAATAFSLEVLRIYGYFALFIPTIIFALTIGIFEQLAERQHLSVDERAFVYARLIQENLEDYFSSTNSRYPERKAICRKEASKNAHKLLSIVERYWTIGEFELAERLLQKPVTDFKENLKNRLVPNIERGDSETFLKAANDIVFQFVAFLSYTPSLDNLEHINSRMQSELAEISPTKEKGLTKTSNFLLKHNLLRHSLFVSGVSAFAFLVYQLGLWGHVTADVAYGSAVTSWVVLIAGYFFESRRKESKD